MEIKLALNRWCRPAVAAAAQSQPLKRPNSSKFLRGVRSSAGLRKRLGSGDSMHSADTAGSSGAGVDAALPSPGSAQDSSGHTEDELVTATAAAPMGPDTGLASHRQVPALNSSSSGGTALFRRSGSRTSSYSSYRALSMDRGSSSSSNSRSFSGVFGGGSVPPSVSLARSSSEEEEGRHDATAGGGGGRGGGAGRRMRAKDRTWVYHALLAVVAQAQREHAVPIAVFI